MTEQPDFLDLPRGDLSAILLTFAVGIGCLFSLLFALAIGAGAVWVIVRLAMEIGRLG